MYGGNFGLVFHVTFCPTGDRARRRKFTPPPSSLSVTSTKWATSSAASLTSRTEPSVRFSAQGSEHFCVRRLFCATTCFLMLPLSVMPRIPRTLCWHPPPPSSEDRFPVFLKWNYVLYFKEEKVYSGTAENFGKQWQIGDVVGVFLDLIDRTISKTDCSFRAVILPRGRAVVFFD